MKKRVLSILCTLALCLTLLPVAAEAAEWEHSDHSSWTALTSDELIASNYALSSGKYYLSGADMDKKASEELAHYSELIPTMGIVME